MLLNRNEAPGYKEISNIYKEDLMSQYLSNGIPFYSISAGTQDIVKIEFVFKAGLYYQSKPLIAAAVNDLLECGSINYSANEISDNLDYLGSFVENQIGPDLSTITLFSLSKHVEQSLHYICDFILNPTFPTDEINIYLSNKKQRFQINSQKVNVVALRHFPKIMFGTSHPYTSVPTQISQFDEVTKEDIIEFYKKYYCPNNCMIVASGKVSTHIIETLNNLFTKQVWKQNIPSTTQTALYVQNKELKHKIHLPEAIQTAIKIGKPLFNHKHKDFSHFKVLNTVLGGYFGSRLMSNIREDKGYTYGINSSLIAYEHGAYFEISTEVAKRTTQKTIEEVYKEIKLLQSKTISSTELKTVKNYMLSQLLRIIDGPFTTSDTFISYWKIGLNLSFINNYAKQIENTSDKDIMRMAQEYLKIEELNELRVGNI